MKHNDRVKILPDKVFYKLWTKANEFNIKQNYISNFTISTNADYINFDKKYNISYEKSIEMLSKIYDAYNMSFADIMNITRRTKAQLSKEFCIPVRTLEAWYDKTNKMPSYIKLMILKKYYLLNLGKYIYIESDLEYIKRKPKIYEKHEKLELTLENSIEDEDLFERYLEKELRTRKKEVRKENNNKSNVADNMSSKSEVEKLLEKTDYLKRLTDR